MWDLLTSLDAWAALLSLTALEIVLGVDNVIFISILVSGLDARRSETARRLGLALAVIFRIALLFTLTSLLGLSAPVFTLWDNAFSWRDLILIFGGLFLIAKATHELHAQIEGQIGEASPAGGLAPALPAGASMALVIGQIVVIDVSGLDQALLARFATMPGVLSAQPDGADGADGPVRVTVHATASDDVLRQVLSWDGAHVGAVRAATERESAQ